MNTKRVVEVEWEDSAGHHGWQTEKQFGSASLITSVGYVLRDDVAQIALVESYDHAEDALDSTHRKFGCAVVIPRSAIRRVTELRTERRPMKKGKQHKMPSGHMMSDAQMKKMMGKGGKPKKR